MDNIYIWFSLEVSASVVAFLLIIAGVLVADQVKEYRKKRKWGR